eukprot:11282975-Alexandrium_andersonii.AAC.1
MDNSTKHTSPQGNRKETEQVQAPRLGADVSARSIAGCSLVLKVPLSYTCAAAVHQNTNALLVRASANHRAR